MDIGQSVAAARRDHLDRYICDLQKGIMVGTEAAATRTLLEDFAQRISALRAEANFLGHTDIGYLLEMAEEIADRRIDVAAMPPLASEGADRLPTG